MRRPSKRPHASLIKPPNGESLQIWGGISFKMPTKFVGVLFYLYNKNDKIQKKIIS